MNVPLEQYYQPVYAKFHVENETLSKVKFDILSPNYKLSLLKERIESGKYFCNNDQSSATTNGTNSDTNGLVKKSPLTGSLSTSIGSTQDVLQNN